MFKKKRIEQPKAPVDRPVNWPSGIAVRTNEGIWYIKNQKRMLVFSERALASWGFNVAVGTINSVSRFAKAGVIGFRDGTLIRDVSDGKIYLIADRHRRHVTSPDVLDLLPWPPVDVSAEEVLIHPKGDELNAI